MNVEFRSRRPRRWEFVAWRCVDVVAAAVLLVVLAPLMALIALAVRLGSRGPVLFRQTRIGVGGRPFPMYKFRTMRPGGSDDDLRALIVRELAGEDTVVDGSTKLVAADRVTSVGRWLRATSLDELPQLYNVLRGDMSLVGPRPCLDWEAELFPPDTSSRFDVLPGMTGLWQVSGRSALTTPEMLRLDVVYVRGWGFWRNVRILAATVPALTRGRAR